MPTKNDTGSSMADDEGGVGGLLDQNPSIAIKAPITAGIANTTTLSKITKYVTITKSCRLRFQKSKSFKKYV